MSELATMAALKITNSINQHYSQQNLDALTPVNQSNMPFLAQSPAQSDTSSSATATNTSTITNTATTKTAASTANTNTPTNNSMHTNPDSPDVNSPATDATLSRQTSADATQSSLHDYIFDESTQTLSSSTSGRLYSISIIFNGGRAVDVAVFVVFMCSTSIFYLFVVFVFHPTALNLFLGVFD